MRSLEEISALLAQDPENFTLLHDMAFLFHQNRNYSGCFVMLERAIASYETNPIPELQPHYFDIKRLHTHLLHDRLQEVLGPAYFLINQRWMPVFKLGRVREIAWNVSSKNLKHVIPALSNSMLKKLRFLSLTIEDSADELLDLLSTVPLNTLRALSIQFSETPTFSIFRQFFTTHKNSFIDIKSLSLRMPRINNTMAVCVRNALETPESLNFTSMDRTLINKDFCEMLADDAKSNFLTRLSLVGTSIGNEGLFAIFSSENFSSLQALDLHDGILSNGAAKVIAAAHNLPNLHTIDLRYNMIDPAGINLLRGASIQCLYDCQHTRPEGR